MSYTQEVISTRTEVYNQIYEYRVISLPTGDPAPSPAPGYAVEPIASGFGKDLYLEYRFIEEAQP